MKKLPKINCICDIFVLKTEQITKEQYPKNLKTEISSVTKKCFKKVKKAEKKIYFELLYTSAKPTKLSQPAQPILQDDK